MGGGMSVNNDDADILSDVTSSSSEENPGDLTDFVDNSIIPPRSNEMELTVDATVGADNLPTARERIRLQDIALIEQQLDEYEVVSLIFLLQDNSVNALRDLEVFLLQGKRNLLSNWAVKSAAGEESANWQNKLVEALCCIQNFAILSSFGFTKSVLESHFLPYQHLASININRGRKIAYKICDSLDKARTDVFLTAVRDYFALNANLPYHNYDKNYLELYFLHWENIGFIRKNDFKSLRSVVKSITELSDIYMMVCDNCSESNANHFNIDRQRFQNHEHDNTNQLISRENFSLTSSMSDRDSNFNDFRYPVDPDKPGICLIINQEYFYKEFSKSRIPDKEKLSHRLGTQYDSERLRDTFNKFGFRVFVRENLTDTAMIEDIRKVVKDFQNESSLFICILSHGEKDHVYGCNNCKVSVNEIQEILCKTNRKLVEKPKFLILQACQGEQCQKVSLVEESEEFLETDGPTSSRASENVIMPNTANLGIFWATVPGYSAVRNKNKGTWFIQSLCTKMLEEGNHRHFSDICTRIIQDVTSKTWRQTEKEAYVMTPMFITTLTKNFYLPPIRD